MIRIEPMYCGVFVYFDGRKVCFVMEHGEEMGAKISDIVDYAQVLLRDKSQTNPSYETSKAIYHLEQAFKLLTGQSTGESQI